MKAIHQYDIQLEWTGNSGDGTASYTSYSRNYTISVEGKEIIIGSSDKAFRGDAEKYSPEELLVSSVSSCHMLWYLHLCAVNGVIVMKYTDEAIGKMLENKDGSGRFEEITLNPEIIVQRISMIKMAKELHREANKMCFIANSLNFPVLHNCNIAAHEK